LPEVKLALPPEKSLYTPALLVYAAAVIRSSRRQRNGRSKTLRYPSTDPQGHSPEEEGQNRHTDRESKKLCEELFRGITDDG
jgi:hypothetical protein